MKKIWAARLRVLSISLLILTLSACGYLTAKKLGISEPEYRVRVEKNVMVPMRDGVTMATDLTFPKADGKFPAILVRTPYGKGMRAILGSEDIPRLFAERGYVWIVQDVRGRYKSGGDFYPFVNDGADGQDMIAWIKQQPWSNGKVGTYGGSYLGTTQWFEAPGQDLAAMHLTVTSPNLKEVLYTGGQLHLMTMFFWANMMGEHQPDVMLLARKISKIDECMAHLPLGEADDKFGRDVDYFNDALDPAKIFEIYKQVDYEERYQQVKAPSLFVAGWYDMFVGPQLKDFNRLIAEGEGNARESLLIVGPWGHGAAGPAVDFGPEAERSFMGGPKKLLAWYDHWVKGMDNEVKDWPRVQIFVMGDNQWRDENEWPLARTVYTDYYLHSGGQANTRGGDGVLSTLAPAGDESADRFAYDPLNPVPTLGGNNLGLNLGAHDQAEVEDRQDVLCYATEVLTSDLEVTGPITAVIYATSDAVDTDFTVKLVDVHPDGKAVNIQDGVVRARYRKNDPSNPTPLTPGEIEEYEIDLWATSNVFKAGHRIRVEVSSSNFPRFNRNLNTGEDVGPATTTVVANQVIHHDADHPSRIILPVIPR